MLESRVLLNVIAETVLSSLGMDRNGDVRSAFEFKEVFEETGKSSGPYSCPFCEVSYEEKCIVTECVKAPHFKLPNGTTHRDGCNGEAGDGATASVSGPPKTPQRMVVGDIELPEALVKRRKPSRLRKPDDDGLGPPPNAVEVARRRKLIAADRTISSSYTTSQLRPVVHAYKHLLRRAYEQATAAGLTRGSVEYNAKFREVLNACDLSLYEHKLTYGSAFQGRRLRPWHLERVYYGSGTVRTEGNYLVITDVDSWPMLSKSRDELAPFDVKLSRTVRQDAPTSHQRAMGELERLALAAQNIEWYAFGLPELHNEKFELLIDSLDHFYWLAQHRR